MGLGFTVHIYESVRVIILFTLKNRDIDGEDLKYCCRILWYDVSSFFVVRFAVVLGILSIFMSIVDGFNIFFFLNIKSIGVWVIVIIYCIFARRFR